MASEEGFEEHHSVDWARPETRAPLCETLTPKLDQTPHCHQDCDHERWDRYEQARFQHIRSLPPAGNGPLRFAWDPEDAELPGQMQPTKKKKKKKKKSSSAYDGGGAPGP